MHMEPGQLRTAQAEVCPAAGSVSTLDIKAAAFMNEYEGMSNLNTPAAHFSVHLELLPLLVSSVG